MADTQFVLKKSCGCTTLLHSSIQSWQLCKNHYLLSCGRCQLYFRVNFPPEQLRVRLTHRCWGCYAFMCEACKKQSIHCTRCFARSEVINDDETPKSLYRSVEDNAIPRPGTGFALFCQRLGPTSASDLDGAWDRLSPEKKEKYNKMAGIGLDK